MFNRLKKFVLRFLWSPFRFVFFLFRLFFLLPLILFINYLRVVFWFIIL